MILHAIRRHSLTLATGMNILQTLATGILNKKTLSYRTLPDIVPTINPITDKMIVMIVVASQSLLTPETKYVVADAACGSVWVNRTPWRVSRTDIEGFTPCNVFNDFSVKHAPSPVLI